jgi:hypothetical protein
MAATLFSLAPLLAAPFWALMILVPTWSWTRRAVSSPLIVLPPAVAYAILVLPHLDVVLPVVTNSSLTGVQGLLSTELGAAASWAHFVAFDLFVGRWIYLDSRERRLHPVMMAPVLAVTILLGPLGLISYLGLRLVRSTPAPALSGATDR